MKMTKYADEVQATLHTKFPNGHFLSKKQNCEHALAWNTFFRRNLHKCATDYLGLKLYFYQQIILYFMGISSFIVIIASRAASKSFVVGIYAVCRCITRPHTLMVIVSSTKKQARIIIHQKIESELMAWSPMLRKEIMSIKDNDEGTEIKFRNRSSILVCVGNDNARGHRSNCLIREEFRQIKKSTDDSVLSPFQIVRTPPYLLLDRYKDIKELREEPTDIYISSSWYDNGHWMWDLVDKTAKDMLNGLPSTVLAFDESIILKEGIKTKKQLIQEKKKQDPLTWRIEFLNERVIENTSAFFTYSMLNQNQTSKQVFYPRKNEDVREKKKNKYFIPKQENEIRLISCDIAFIENKNNDNSIFTCMRLIPESTVHLDDNQEVITTQGYKRSVPYMQSIQGGDTTKQALKIRRLYEDFDGDYIVLDTRNGGIAILDMLSKTMYDEERNVEYAPLKCMNNEAYANRIKNPNAKPVIYAINASQQLNSEIAFEFRQTLKEGNIQFLVNYNEAVESILTNIPEYQDAKTADEQLFYEQPFLETQMLISETADLMYEKKQQTGAIRIYEQGNNRKDRYTSCSYGNHMAYLLEQDLLSEDSNYDFGIFVN